MFAYSAFIMLLVMELVAILQLFNNIFDKTSTVDGKVLSSVLLVGTLGFCYSLNKFFITLL